MIAEDLILYSCARQAFGAEHRRSIVESCRATTVDWPAIFAIAEAQAVAPLVHHNLSKIPESELDLPQAVHNQFQRAYMRNVIVKQRVAETIRSALEFLRAKALDVMLIKGEALNLMVYDQPWYTVSTDVDLVIRNRRSEISHGDFQDLARFFSAINEDPSPIRTTIEFDFFEHHDVTMNNVLPVDSGGIWRDAQSLSYDGLEIFVMTPEDMLLAAAINACRKRFYWVKALCDVAEIVRKFPDLDWDKFASRAQDCRSNSIAYTALLVTQGTLGCDLPAAALPSLGVNPVRASAIRRLVGYYSARVSLGALSEKLGPAILGRRLTRTLLLTYATYRMDNLASKAREILAARNR